MSVHPVPIFPTHPYAVSAPSASAPQVRPSTLSPVGRYGGLRVGDVERTEACDVLARHFAEGRLSPDELDVRLAVATSAVTQSDLSGLLVDLPRGDHDRAQSVSGYDRAPRPVTTPATGADVLTWVGVICALGLILVMMVAIGFMSPIAFVASAFGGMVSLGLGGGLVHLMHRSVDRRRPPAV